MQLHDPLKGTTPSQRLAAAAKNMRRDKITALAKLDTPISCPSASAKPLAPNAFDGTATITATVTNEMFDVAWHILDDLRPVLFGQVEAIQRAVVSAYPKITLNDIKSARRTADVVRPRQIAMYLVKELTPRSLPDIGRRFGGRDHTTVLHAVRKIAGLIKQDKELADHVDAIKATLEATSDA